MSEELAIKQPMEVQAQPSDLLQVIARAASDPNVDVVKMQALMDMHERLAHEQQRVIFAAAMSRLQAKLPQMNKYGQGKNSKFAKLEDIDRVIKPLLAEEGFNLSFNEESHNGGTVTFIARIAHAAGHSESQRLTVPLDTAAKNREGNSVRPAIQDAGSTVSYAKRYLLKMLLNIIETDEDTDGEKREPISQEQARDIEAAIDEVKMDKGKFLIFMGVGDVKDILQRDLKKALNAIDTRRRNPK